MKSLFAASALLAAIPAFAQAGPGGPGGPGMHGGFGGPFGMHKVVTNAPYSATFTNTSTEKLQDGTVLTHTSTRNVERDSLGRVREDVTLPARSGDASPHIMTTIFDPVAKTVTMLRPAEKVAMVRSLPDAPQGGRRGPGGPPPADGSASQTNGHGPREDKDVTSTDLGSKTIGGVLATGKRRTRTIPAGAMGNSAPITSTHEDWYSSDLQIELSRSDSDPFHGTDSMTATALTKAEPDATLFQVPSGYTVRQAPQRAFGHGPRRGGDNPPPPPPAGM